MRATRIDVEGYAEVYALEGSPSGFVALHRLRGGKAFGGCRIRAYPEPRAALDDALRLARAMTLKLASVDIPGGGGKAVLEATSLGGDRAGAIARFAAWVDSLGGRYVTGPDLGVGAADIAVLAARTTSLAHGDLAVPAALGVRQALRGAFRVLGGDPALAGRAIAVQGLGAVGGGLCRLLAGDRARVIGADVDPARTRTLEREAGIEAVPSDAILAAEADALAPCAVGGVLTAGLVATLRTRLVCGGANNILDDDTTADLLHQRGIVFVPDFLANAGGAIQGAWSHLLGPGDHTAKVLELEERVADLLGGARARGVAPLRLALERWQD